MNRNLMSLDPFDEVDQAWDDDFLTTGARVDLDVYQDQSNVIVETEIPGVKPEEVNITVENDILTISGNKQDKKEVKREDYYRKEMRSGSFSRSVMLPMQVKNDQAKARFKDGVLKITLPKADETKSRKIKIEASK
jgi:HSP20 family protein